MTSVDTAKLKVEVFHVWDPVYKAELDGRIELGRQRKASEPLFSPQQVDGRWRVCIADLSENSISREHVLIEQAPHQQVRITNLSSTNRIVLNDDVILNPHQSQLVDLPAQVRIDVKTVRIDHGAEPIELQSLLRPTQAPVKAEVSVPVLRLAPTSLVASEDAEALVEWFQAIMGVLQSAASSTDFFDRAAHALVDLVGLDCGRVLVRHGDVWGVEATELCPLAAEHEYRWRASQHILNQVLEHKRTFWHVPGTKPDTASLIEVEAVIAAPILDSQRNVIGVLYGDRRYQPATRDAPISKLEAMLVETLAFGVAAGLARIEHERAALAAQVRFEQFFTPELSQQLAIEPDLLAGRDAAVTLLFCDIRRFSSFSSRLGPAGTFDFIGDIMSLLSEFVSAEQGVLVDYIGDELIAMWGAPTEQSDQSERACRAAKAMLAALSQQSAKWETLLGEPVRCGIGINTGVARVGNTGSKRKFKYGPLGNTVNLASRVQGATKYLGVDILITAATNAQLVAAGTLTRRLCKVQVVNIPQPVELFEVPTEPDPSWTRLKTEYEAALDAFEAQEFQEAAKLLGGILVPYPNDGPTLALLARSVAYLRQPDQEFNPAWELPGK